MWGSLRLAPISATVILNSTVILTACSCLLMSNTARRRQNTTGVRDLIMTGKISSVDEIFDENGEESLIKLHITLNKRVLYVFPTIENE